MAILSTALNRSFSLGVLQPLAVRRTASLLAARGVRTLPSALANSYVRTKNVVTPFTGVKNFLLPSVLRSRALASNSPNPNCPNTPHKYNLPESKFELSHSLHPFWTPDQLSAIEVTHHVPKRFIDKSAYYTVMSFRFFYDILTGYKYGRRDDLCFIRRIIFLETIAGVPGMVGAMVRHLHSLRKMERDYGWIHTLLEEAENERMHLMTAMNLLPNPSLLIRSCVLGAQWVFLCWYTAMYFISPSYCHRFVGYIEEEAVVTYTDMIKYIDRGVLPMFTAPAPPQAIAYWQLPRNANMRDVILNIRADESHHREVNHTFAEMSSSSVNPFEPGF